MHKIWVRVVLWVGLVIGGGVSVAAQGTEGSRGDRQLWTDLQLSIKLHPQISATFFGTVRGGRNISAIVDTQIGAGLSFSFGKYFSLSPNYRHVTAKPSPTRRTQEHRFFVDLTVRVPLRFGLSLSDRQRGELRGINGVISGRYRHRLQLERALTLHDHKLTPYLSGEMIYDSRYHAWARNRIFIGARLPVQKHLTLDSYYGRQHDGRSRPGYLHLVGMIFCVEL
jgi:hypothetical protein